MLETILLLSAWPPRFSTPGRACKNVTQPCGHLSHLLYLRPIDAEQTARKSSAVQSGAAPTAICKIRMCGPFSPLPYYCECTLVLTSLCTSALSLLPNCHSSTDNAALNKRQNKSTAVPNTQENLNLIEHNDKDRRFYIYRLMKHLQDTVKETLTYNVVFFRSRRVNKI